MIDLFVRKLPPGRYTGIIAYPAMEFARRNIKLWINTVLNYYNTRRKRAIKNQNMLAKLIEISLPDTHMDIVDYYMHVRAIAKYNTRRFGIVSNIFKGSITHNVLRDGASEVFILVEKDINPLEFHKDFMDRAPIKMIYHNDINLTYDLQYYHAENQTNDELYIYELDFVEMMMQYRSWSLWRENMGASIDINQYVAMVLIPNILLSSFDRYIWNRFKYISNNEDPAILKQHVNKHPFLVPNYDIFVDRILVDIVEQYKYKAFRVDRVINTVPTVFSENMLEQLRLGNAFTTAQSLWSSWLARAEDMLFLLEFLGVQGRKRNREFVTKIPYQVKALKNRITELPLNTPSSIRDKYNTTLDSLVKIAEL